jgi:S1-C subfamily serine protease
MKLKLPLLATTALLVASLACAVPSQVSSTPVPVSTYPPLPTAVVLSPAATQASTDPSLPQATTVPIVFNGSSQQDLYINLYQRVNPSVVSIRVLDNNGIDQALGSGFVYDDQGHIVTNNHVVEGAAQLEVDFSNGFQAMAKVVGTEPTADLAVIKIDAPAGQLIPIALADSDAVQVGEQVIAIGNPFGFSGTMTIGIVSGLGRVLSPESSTSTTTTAPQFSAPDVIQTDAAINPGNSGGPLLDLTGQVIGVNKALESQTGVNSGVGFAVASNTLKRIIPALIESGKFQYPFLGMSSTDGLTLVQQKSLGLPTTPGAYVTDVVAGGPADKGGVVGDKASTGNQRTLQGGGDLIVAIDGHPVKAFADVLSYLVNHADVGQTITLTVVRGGANKDLQVTLGARP